MVLGKAFQSFLGHEKNNDNSKGNEYSQEKLEGTLQRQKKKHKKLAFDLEEEIRLEKAESKRLKKQFQKSQEASTSAAIKKPDDGISTTTTKETRTKDEGKKYNKKRKKPDTKVSVSPAPPKYRDRAKERREGRISDIPELITSKLIQQQTEPLTVTVKPKVQEEATPSLSPPQFNSVLAKKIYDTLTAPRDSTLDPTQYQVPGAVMYDFNILPASRDPPCRTCKDYSHLNIPLDTTSKFIHISNSALEELSQSFDRKSRGKDVTLLTSSTFKKDTTTRPGNVVVSQSEAQIATVDIFPAAGRDYEPVVEISTSDELHEIVPSSSKQSQNNYGWSSKSSTAATTRTSTMEEVGAVEILEDESVMEDEGGPSLPPSGYDPLTAYNQGDTLVEQGELDEEEMGEGGWMSGEVEEDASTGPSRPPSNYDASMAYSNESEQQDIVVVDFPTVDELDTEVTTKGVTAIGASFLDCESLKFLLVALKEKIRDLRQRELDFL